MRRLRLMIPVLAGAIGLIAPQARATSITWTLSGATFADGSTATGFAIDPSGGTVTPEFLTAGQWSIAVTSGLAVDGTTTLSAFTYDSTNSTARLINDPPGSPVPGSGLEIDTTAACSQAGTTLLGFCRSLILDAGFLDPTLTSVALDTTFSTEGCTGCASGLLNTGREFSSGTWVPSITTGTGGGTVPEPGSLPLLGAGLAALAGLIMRKKGSLAGFTS